MTALVPLTVAVPLLAAALVGALDHVLPFGIGNTVATAAAAAVTAMCVLLLVHTAGRPIDYWFGGWHPRHGVAIGIAFHVEPLAAALAALAGALVTASLAFAWSRAAGLGTYFYVLMLVFLAGLVGFALSADLFNIVVFFELLSVCAYALTAFRSDQWGPLQGGIVFAATNTVGAFLLLVGVGLLYGSTGALNLAQAGQALAARQPHGLSIVAFTLILVGFLTKAGIVPFHFWLSDAYAVAPVAVTAIFAGVMSDLALHAISKVYWTVFSGQFGAGGASVGAVLVALGALSAVFGAVMAFLQASLKRMAAFVVVAHGGAFLIGIGVLAPRALAGETVWVVADGLAKAAFVLVVGAVVAALRDGDEVRLRGAGRGRWGIGALLVACGLAFAGLPPFGTYLGTDLVSSGARAAGYGYLDPVLFVSAALTGAAVLRATGRIVLGLGGGGEDPLLTHDPQREREEEPAEARPRAGRLLVVPAAALLVVSFGLAFAPGLARQAERAAAAAEDRPALAAQMLHGRRPEPPPLPRARPLDSRSLAWSGAAVLAAFALAGLALARRRLPRALRASGRLALLPLSARLRALHTGAVGDYVAWVVAGSAALGGLFAVTLR